MNKLPPEFRAKFDQLTSVIDSRTGKPVTASLGEPYECLKNHPAGGQRFNFWGGDLSSFDHTGRFPIVVIYGPIYNLYNNLANDKSPFGRALTDVQDLRDGSRCCQFEGGHIHEIGDKALPFPASQCIAPYQPPIPPFPMGAAPAKMPLIFHQRWVEISFTRNPVSNLSIAEELSAPYEGPGNNHTSGQWYRFWQGHMVSVDNVTPPCVLYGPINKLWVDLGATKSGWGRPLTDEQDTEDGGRCSVFEGGHIHRYGDVVRPVAAEACTAKYKPAPRTPNWSKMPPAFQRKWTQLSLMFHPQDQKSLVELLGGHLEDIQNNPEGLGGQCLKFWTGYLVSLTNDPNAFNVAPNTPIELTSPFAVYGGIFNFWNRAGGLKSSYGRPLCDEQSLPDGSRCSIFERGHIHWINGEAKGFPANECTAPYQPQRPEAPTLPSFETQTNYQNPSYPTQPQFPYQSQTSYTGTPPQQPQFPYPSQTSHTSTPPPQSQVPHQPYAGHATNTPPPQPQVPYQPYTSTPPPLQPQPSYPGGYQASPPMQSQPYSQPQMSFNVGNPPKPQNTSGGSNVVKIVAAIALAVCGFEIAEDCCCCLCC